eukprot:Opistho-2@85007
MMAATGRLPRTPRLWASVARCVRMAPLRMAVGARHCQSSATAPRSAVAYDHRTLEAKWQRKWIECPPPDLDLLPASMPKFYALSMFPYPSGSLHMGHVRVYAISDCTARVHRMRGYKVLHPMGWDAFGLPAENAAIERGIPTKEWTVKNIGHMRTQLNALGLSFDWHREISTCDPSYYKWTQWLFLRMHREGLAYQKEATVNWDPVDNTVLANEQVDGEGRSWRSGAVVERRLLNQWFLKITKFAEPLLNDLDGLAWPENVKAMQRHWIGKSLGAALEFPIGGAVGQSQTPVKIFTTRPDTICGVTFLAVAPEHPIVKSGLVPPERRQELDAFVNEVLRTTEMDRITARSDDAMTGMYTGVRCVHPITREEVPVFVAKYVLSGYGEGAVMGVPAHDERDFAFAQKNGLEVRPVLQRREEGMQAPSETPLPFCEEDNAVVVNSTDALNGLSSREAAEKVVSLAISGRWGEGRAQYRLRDWLISRQRYWAHRSQSFTATCVRPCPCQKQTSPCCYLKMSPCPDGMDHLLRTVRTG